MQINKNKFLLSIGKCEYIEIYLLFPIESEEKQRFMNNSRWKQRKKVFFRPVSTNEESKNGKVCSAGRKTTFLSRTGVLYFTPRCELFDSSIKIAFPLFLYLSGSFQDLYGCH